MELILFIGLPGSGKSSFYKENFFNSHVRISMDLLKTRNKERQFLELGFDLQQRMVVDNTNVAAVDRELYIETAKNNRYKVIGYYFDVSVKDCITRNAKREGRDKVAEKVIYIKNSQLVLPKYEEGFDLLYKVNAEAGKFQIKEWGPVSDD